MPADTFSSVLGVLIMGTGNDNNTWGDNHNNSVTLQYEKAISGLVTHAVTGGTLDHSGSPPPAGPTQAMELMHKFTGVLVATQNYVVPGTPKVLYIFNDTTGNFGLLVGTATNKVNCPAGQLTIVTILASNDVRRHDANEVGSVVQYMGSAAIPTNMFEMDGATKLVADYPDLFTKIGNLYGGAGSLPATGNFVLPDVKTAGKFLRSRTGSVTIGTAQADQLISHTHTTTVTFDNVNDPAHASMGNNNANHTHGGTTGVPNSSLDHTHTGAVGAVTVSDGGSGFSRHAHGGSAETSFSSSSGYTLSHTHDYTTGFQSANHQHAIFLSNTFTSATPGAPVAIGAETRPTNYSCFMGIRY